MNKILEWIWSKLPDHCVVVGCARAGMRGNENRVPVGRNKYVVMCDYCSSEDHHAKEKADT